MIDLQLAARAASIGCTADGIAALFGIGRRTFYDHLKEDPDLKDAIEEGRALGRVTLRRLQWPRAMAGNVTMLIWLGKQYLGQRDRPVIDDDPDRPPSYVVYTPAPIEDDAPKETLIDDGVIEVDD